MRSTGPIWFPCSLALCTLPHRPTVGPTKGDGDGPLDMFEGGERTRQCKQPPSDTEVRDENIQGTHFRRASPCSRLRAGRRLRRVRASLKSCVFGSSGVQNSHWFCRILYT